MYTKYTCLYMHVYTEAIAYNYIYALLQVNDASQYYFEPRKLVKGIISIYLNLGREENFCAALPRDGRSFSMDLFTQAERVIRCMNNWGIFSNMHDICIYSMSMQRCS